MFLSISSIYQLTIASALLERFFRKINVISMEEWSILMDKWRKKCSFFGKGTSNRSGLQKKWKKEKGIFTNINNYSI